ncbi:hypothetical protein [Enterococcus thailandicus]|uniref:hypothetical protein n=1 Tax=Enterococcus thailandicus TaxID=417368 RepID=UPI0022EC0602|nr:hypothetical protein [Enterococcus thailandicus]MDA3964174.1 hypothetical protein [Enterococcus thailandicus]
MKIKSINNFSNREFQIDLDNEEAIKIAEPEYFETLVMLIIKILDNNFSYDTTDNVFEFDNCINFLCIIYQSTVYVENIHNKKEIYFTAREEEGYPNLRFLNKKIRKKSEIFFPDFYTYFTGAYSNLNVLYRVLKNFVRKSNLTFDKSKNEVISEFLFIRNKLLIHPEDNLALADYFDNPIIGMNEMDWLRSLKEGEDAGTIYHYYYKGSKREIDLAKKFLIYTDEILFEFLHILLKNEKTKISDTNFSIKEFFPNY